MGEFGEQPTNIIQFPVEQARAGQPAPRREGAQWVVEPPSAAQIAQETGENYLALVEDQEQKRAEGVAGKAMMLFGFLGAVAGLVSGAAQQAEGSDFAARQAVQDEQQLTAVRETIATLTPKAPEPAAPAQAA